MIYIKKFFFGLTVILSFNNFAFATNIKEIVIEIEEVFSPLEQMAYYEYKNLIGLSESEEANLAIKQTVNERFKNYADIFAEEGMDYYAMSKFTQEFIKLAQNVKDQKLEEMKLHGYTNINDYKGVNPSIYTARIVASCFVDILGEITLYLTEGNSFSEDQYKECISAFSDTNKLAADKKESLFKTFTAMEKEFKKKID